MVYKLSWNGLTELSGKAKGNETLGVGIRPYGLHAGNLASVVAYPYLFLENYAEVNRKSPRFTFQVWLNDIEPTKYVGADGRPESADWANMYPAIGSTSFQLTPAPNAFKGNLVDYWQPAIEGVVRGTIGARFPEVTLEFRRASELVDTPEFEKAVTGCIKNAERVKNIINRWNTGVAEVKGPHSFVWPLIPGSNVPLRNPALKQVEGEDLIAVPDGSTQNHATILRPVRELSWAVQFRMLHAARLAAIKPDIWFMGMDHVPTNMGNLIEQLADTFRIDRYKGKFLHAPLLFANGNKKLSKSLGNAVYMPVEELLDALRYNPNAGLDMKAAPLSPDILSIGPNLLPDHIVGFDREQRTAAIEKKMNNYKRSRRPRTFRAINAAGKITNKTIANMLGVPHI